MVGLGFLDWGGVIANIVSNFYLFKKRVEYWLWSVVGNSLWLLYFTRQEKWIAAGLQISFILFSIYGWWRWRKEANGYPIEEGMERLGSGMSMLILLISFAFTPFDGVDTWLEATGTALFVTANWMTAKKWRISWYIWILGSVVFAIWTWRLGAYGMFAAQFVFIGLSVYGLYAWDREQDSIENPALEPVSVR